jgi:hypothetical protein
MKPLFDANWSKSAKQDLQLRAHKHLQSALGGVATLIGWPSPLSCSIFN